MNYMTNIESPPMTAPLSEQEIAETLAIIEDGERVHGDWAAHPGSPAHAQRWIQWAADNRYVWPRIFATIRADRARIAELEQRQSARLEQDARPCCQQYESCTQRCWPLIGHLRAQLAERTRERDRARSYCAELASYVCEPIYDDVRNRAGIAADASAAAGDEMSMRWHDVQKAQARAESVERQMEKMRDRLFERGEMALAPCFVCGYNGPNYFQPDVHPCAARHHAAIAQQEGRG